MRAMGRLALVAACWALVVRSAAPLTAEEAAAAASRAAAGAVDHGRLDRTDALDEDKKTDGKIGAGGATGRGGGAGARDQQLLSVLAARRRRLLRERLADHLTTIATLANKPNRNNATFAQLELRDSNSTVFKRIVLSDNNGANFRNATPVIRIETPVNLYREQQSRTSERPVVVSTRAYQESKVRAGFLNNRRKTSPSDLPRYGSAFRKHPSSSDELLEQVEYTKKETILPQYVPGEGKEENVESAVLDPDEEFQVDESNHGLYLLNYSDTTNATEKNNGLTLATKVVDNANKSIQLTTESPVKFKNKSEDILETSTINVPSKLITSTTTERVNRSVTEMNNANVNVSSTKITKPAKVESITVKENENKTLFISDELYKHFRPLETELPVEDMEPFLYFGQKINTPIVPGDNLTNAPNLSASTKSVQYLNLPEKKRFPIRIPVTDKIKYLKANDDEELNEDMDVSVVKNVIEKNKIRTSVKVLSPLRHINPYRKLMPTSPTKFNITHIIPQGPISNILTNNTNHSSVTGKMKDETTSINRTMYANVRNYTRIPYTTFKRRPVKVTPSVSNSNVNVTQNTDTKSTTDKPSTLIYTAVVTSVSVTSSMKGQNKTDSMPKNNTDVEIKDKTNNTINLQTRTKALDVSSTKNNTSKTENSSNATSAETKIGNQSVFSRPKVRITTIKNIINITSTTPGPAILFNKFLNRTNKVRFKDTLDSIITSDFNKKVSNSSIPKINIRPIAVETRLGFDDFITNSFSETTVTQPPTPVTNTPFIIRYTTYQTSTEEKIDTVSNNEEQLKPRPKDAETPNFINTASAVDYEAPSTPKLNILDNNFKTDKNNTEKNRSASIHDSREKNDIATAANDGVVIEAEKTYTATYVLAGLGFLPVTAIIVFVLRSVFLNKTKDIDTEYEGYFQESEVKKESQVTPVARPPAPPPVKPDQKWEFPRNKLRLQTLLGQGNFGQVWKAEADDLSGHDGLTRLVAVKTIKESASQKEKQELLHEICIMQKLGTHPNVVTLLACCTEQEPYLLVMEYVMCGKLLTYLRERRSRPDRFGGGSGALAARDLTVFAYCVARGMEYLASKGIVHRDLAARNILVDHNKLCKVADFGMSRANGGAGGAGCAGGTGGERRRHALPVRWMAPESLLYDLYSHETDVWAYGILLWEIVTLGSTPYASMSGREVLQVVTEGYRLERPAHCSPQLYRTMHACWHADAAQRPTFADIKGQIAALLDNEPADGHYVDLDSFYQDSSVYSDPSAIINDDAGISIEYERELKPERAKAELPRRSFHKSTTNLHRNLSSGNYDQRNITFTFRDTNFNQIRPNLHVTGINSPRMGGFGIRDLGFNTRENSFTDNVKLSSSSFHREQRESNRDNPASKSSSFKGTAFQHNRMGSRDAGRDGRGFQLKTDGNRNKRVSEFECDI